MSLSVSKYQPALCQDKANTLTLHNTGSYGLCHHRGSTVKHTPAARHNIRLEPSVPAPKPASQPITAHLLFLNPLCPNTTETSAPTTEFRHNKAHSLTFTICFQLGGECRLVGFLRRNVKAAWRVCQIVYVCLCVCGCVCVASYLC